MTQDEINLASQVFEYAPETGQLFRKLSSAKVEQVRSISSNGYCRVGIFGRRIHAHRLIWALVHGKWPAGLDIDHINGIRSDNRLQNLRAVDRSTNLENIKQAKSNNKSTGLLGAYSLGRRFTSRIQVRGKGIYLGVFDTAEQAHAAYIAAKQQHHKGAVF
jgi:hypothetical protein